MKDKKLACFYITGELLLDFIKEKTGLPKDTELILVTDKKDQPIKDKRIKEFMGKKHPEGEKNIIVFIATSKDFSNVLDYYPIPIIDLKVI